MSADGVKMDPKDLEAVRVLRDKILEKFAVF